MFNIFVKICVVSKCCEMIVFFERMNAKRGVKKQKKKKATNSINDKKCNKITATIIYSGNAMAPVV